VKSNLLYQTISLDRRIIDDWKDIQLNTRKNTGRQDLIITPIYYFGFNTFSERGILLEARGIGFAKYAPDLYKQTLNRVKDYNIDLFDYKNYSQLEGDLKEIYLGFDENDFLRLSKKYEAEYLVTEKRQRLNFPVIYENNNFILYRLQD
jgi:hypothetical protein